MSKLIQNVESDMRRTIESLKKNFSNVRTGRANPGILENVLVDYLGSLLPLSKVANIVSQDARTLAVNPWDKAMLPKIEKAIRDSDLGANPSNQGSLILVPFPALTQERRMEIVKALKKEGEDFKVAVRNIRRDANNHLKQEHAAGRVSDGAMNRDLSSVQTLTDKFIDQISDIVSKKEREISSV